jgi:hypothetical protein
MLKKIKKIKKWRLPAVPSRISESLSPVAFRSRCPSSRVNLRASSPNVPNVSSLDCEWTKQILRRKLGIQVSFLSLRFSWRTSWSPRCNEMCCSCKVCPCMYVASHTRLFPLVRGVSVTPSALLPSVWNRVAQVEWVHWSYWKLVGEFH